MLCKMATMLISYYFPSLSPGACFNMLLLIPGPRILPNDRNLDEHVFHDKNAAIVLTILTNLVGN